MKQAILKHYKACRSNGVSAQHALNLARYVVETREEWHDEWMADLVKLEVEPDEVCDIDDLTCDRNCFRTAEEHERHVAETAERANHYGVWGLVGYYRLDEGAEWEQASSCWGFVGDDWKEWEVDCQSETLAALRRARLLRAEEEEVRAAGLLGGCDCA